MLRYGCHWIASRRIPVSISPMSAAPASPPLVAPAKLPPPIPLTVRRFRTPKKNIPQTKWERDRILNYIRDYVEREKPVPPLPQEDLLEHATRLVAELSRA